MEISSLLSGETGDAYKPDPSRSNGVMVHNQSQSPRSQGNTDLSNLFIAILTE